MGSMSTERASRVAAFALALVLAMGGGALAEEAQPSETEEGGWNQGRVAAIAEEFAAEMVKLRSEAKRVPPDISFSQQRAQYQMQEDIRLLKNTSGHLASQLRAGKSREETRPVYNRLETLVKSAEENARKTLVPGMFMDQILAAGGVLLQLRPYYRDEERPESASAN